MEKVSTFEPSLRAEVTYRILTDQQVRSLLLLRSHMSMDEYRKSVIEQVVDNLKPFVITKLATLPPEQAKKVSNALYQSAIALNPDLDLITNPSPKKKKPITKEKVLGLAEVLKSKVKGQDKVIDRMVAHLKHISIGLGDETKPRGVFLFVGPSGVGKTLLAKSIHEALFTDKMIRVDCSEYSESHTKSRLIGSPPGYVGYESGGQLTEKVKENPNSVILLDEIEKAHANLFDLFLQVFDEGILTDSKGETVDFTGCIIIMTSNIGTDKISAPTLGFVGEKVPSRIILKSLKDSFRTEFLGRIDDVMVFDVLSPQDLSMIAQMQLGELAEKIAPTGVTFRWAQKVVDQLVREAVASPYGARQMSHLIASKIKDKVADLVFTNQHDCVLRAEMSPSGAVRFRRRKPSARRQTKDPLGKT